VSRAVVVAAGGAPWESEVLEEIDRSPGLRLMRRCLDLAEVLALAELCDVAVVSTDLAGIGADSIGELERQGVRVVGIGDDLRGHRLGITMVQPGGVYDGVYDGVHDGVAAPAGDTAHIIGEAPVSSVIAVWGPHGAPGRSVIAVTLAAILAGRTSRTALVDADPRGGAVAQLLGLLDDVSGLAAACRSADRGDLAEILHHTVMAGPGLRVLTGVPRADMWSQIRRAPFELVLTHLAAGSDHVVVDTGPSLDDHTRLVLEAASQVIVVGRADPVGLARLVRAVHELSEVPCTADRIVVVNQLRSSSSWSARDINGALERLAGVTSDVVLAADYPTLDMAALRGLAPVHVAPGSPFVEGVRRIAQSLERPRALASS
jgi:MinD-like ATPase involved in chromosome partitioning or flagellar assembly